MPETAEGASQEIRRHLDEIALRGLRGRKMSWGECSIEVQPLRLQSKRPGSREVEVRSCSGMSSSMYALKPLLEILIHAMSADRPFSLKV